MGTWREGLGDREEKKGGEREEKEEIARKEETESKQAGREERKEGDGQSCLSLIHFHLPKKDHQEPARSLQLAQLTPFKSRCPRGTGTQSSRKQSPAHPWDSLAPEAGSGNEPGKVGAGTRWSAPDLWPVTGSQLPNQT